MKEFKKTLKVLALVILGYLMQVCAMPKLAVLDVTGNLLFAVLAVITVSYGKKYAFCASCIAGICMECMLSNVQALYALAYPIVTMLSAQAFADMSERKRERLRSQNRGKKHYRDTDLPTHLRILLCSAMMDLIMHIVLCAYMYLIGVDLSWLHMARALLSTVYTVFAALVIMVPVRMFLGMYERKKKDRKVREGGRFF